MKVQKQLFRHKPDEAIYGDCHRTAIACALGLDAHEVPHFMNGTNGKGPAPEAHNEVEKWLNERGITQINMIFDGSLSVEMVLQSVKNINQSSSGFCYILGGESATGVNHSVVCCDGAIVCDPSLDDAGIVGPCDDGFYWVTFFGSTQATHKDAD